MAKTVQWIKLDDAVAIVRSAEFDINVVCDLDSEDEESVHTAANQIAQQVCDAVAENIIGRLTAIDNMIETHFDIVDGEVIGGAPGEVVTGLTS